MKSLKDFLLEPVYFKWYRDDESIIFRKILNEFGIKNNIDAFVRNLYDAAEVIRHLDQGEKVFYNSLKFSHSHYCKNNANEPQLSIEIFDDYLYRWAMKVWPRAFDMIHEYTGEKYVWS